MKTSAAVLFTNINYRTINYIQTNNRKFELVFYLSSILSA